MKRAFKIAVMLIMLFPLWGYAQQHELSISAGGGLSTLKYNPSIGRQNLGLGGHFGFGYHYFFSPSFGIGTGIEFGFYNSKFKLDNLNTAYKTTDMEDNDFEFRSNVKGYEETQTAAYLQIPLMLQYQFGKEHRYYIAGGFKAGIPLSGKYSNKAAEINNSGHFEKEDYEYTNKRFVGFGLFDDRRANGEFSKVAFFASLEAGRKWKLNDKVSLYTGAYFDYALNNVIRDQSLPFVEYQSDNGPDYFEVNSILNSQYKPNGEWRLFTKRITPLAAGVKVRLAFDRSKKQSAESLAENRTLQPAPETKEEPLPEEETPQPVLQAETLQPEPEEELLLPEPQLALQPEPEAEPQPTAEAPVETPMESVIKEDVALQWFVNDYKNSETVLTKRQQQDLNKIIENLQQDPCSKFYIYGHTCNLGNDRINERFGLQRAEKAREYMLPRGIAEDRILGIVSKGSTEPHVPNTSEANRRENRRIEIRFSQPTNPITSTDAEQEKDAVSQWVVDDYKNSEFVLTSRQKQKLDDIIAELQRQPDTKIHLSGHTCTLGNDRINEKIGMQRAEKTKEYMLSKGIAEERIVSVVSKGSAQAHVANTSETNRRQNRRVEITAVPLIVEK